MILSSLSDLYHRLLANPDPVSGLPRVPPYGFTDENISFCLVLSSKGELVDVADLRKTQDKKTVAKRLSVPRPEKRTSGVKPNFLWDKTAYVLGIEGNKDKKAAKETPCLPAEKTHESFKHYHLEKLKNESDAGLQALRTFLKNWQPEQFTKAPFTLDMVDANVVFKLDGELGYIHERSAAQSLWLSILQPDEASNTQPSTCLVTGAIGPTARLHPSIKGGFLSLYGGQSSGCSIVSFNKEHPAFSSLGKEQGDNAPVSEQAAFAYTTALNYLLRRENEQCISIGDSSTVFWAQAKEAQAEQAAVHFFSAFMSPPSDDGQTKKLKFSLGKIAQGRPLQEIAPGLDPGTRFFVLGLAPNAARLSIRYWLNTSMGELGAHLSEHWQDLQIKPMSWQTEKPPSIQKLLLEVVPLRKKDGRYDYASRKFDDIPPQLAGELLRSILTGQRYPQQLLTQLVQRMRADGDINGLRIALVKAVLHRDHRKDFLKEEIPMSLDLENAPVAYRLGCLFAVLERAQSEAIPGANATIVDRYYGTASSVPYSVFPRLIAGFQNHISKIRKDKPGFAVNLGKQIGEILEKLPSSFPNQLSIEQQGQFAVGYYHQRQSFFAKKSAETGSETSTESNPSN
jgi:CRISPR-associated protein Csd1